MKSVNDPNINNGPLKVFKDAIAVWTVSLWFASPLVPWPCVTDKFATLKVDPMSPYLC